MSQETDRTDQTVPAPELAPGDPIRIDAGGWGLTWVVRDDRQLAQIALGPQGHLGEVDRSILGLYPLAYRSWGAGDPFHESALRVTHADGSLTTRLRAIEVEREPDLDDAGEHVVVTCTDESADLVVQHHFRTHPASAVLEQWVEIQHHEPGPVRLSDYDSICHMLVISPNARICQFGGSGWADEWRWTTEEIHTGIRVLSSLGGVQPHLQRSPMLILHPDGMVTDGIDRSKRDRSDTDPEYGTPTIGMSIAWGGNTRFHLAARPSGGPDDPTRLTLKAGANPYGADYVLDPGERFVTPTVAWTWADGRSQMTERFHDWTRARVLRDPERLRPIVSNNWEATGFEFDQDRITDLIGASADLGAEVFLLDDGWFGSDFPRDDDTQGLGDWEVNTGKLRGGLAALTDAAIAAGIRMGIWVEPEMVNPRSNLYSQHPEWVPHDRSEPGNHRWQLYLDPLIAEVRDFEASVVDSTLASAPDISYVKWDANRLIADPATDALSADRASNLFVDGVKRTWEVMQRVADQHPGVELMLCASGGGRNDHGTLRFFHEFWTSDNTDPVTRISMQWAATHFFPPSVVAAHVTRWGERPIGFACAVALSARFGLDLDLTSLSNDESSTLRSTVSLAMRTRHLVQQGQLIRLVSPIGDTPGVPMGQRAALCYRGTRTSGGEDEAVIFRYRISDDGPMPDRGVSQVSNWNAQRLDWIDPATRYIMWHTTFDETATPSPTEFLSGTELLERLDDPGPTEPLSADIFEIRVT